MVPFSIFAFGTLHFVVLGRLVFFDSWREFLLSLHLVKHPTRVCEQSGFNAMARFATVKLLLLIGFSALLSFLTVMAWPTS